MPTISIFYGIVIQMFWNEHAPPHFHARYGELEGSISIKELKIIEGNLPKNAVNLILKWVVHKFSVYDLIKRQYKTYMLFSYLF